jgi:hypothetical protein
MSVRRAGPATVLSTLACLALLTACGTTLPASGTTSSDTHTTSSPSPTDRLSLGSSITAHAALPHRIRWIATPSVPADQISEVDFLIDGRRRWLEHNPPYYYGHDGNFLVTSFLSPGSHSFTVKATTMTGKSASTTVTANVQAAPPPPRALAGTWKRFKKQTDPSAPPSGYWRLVINQVGWRIDDTSGGGNMLDVAYLSPGLVEVRTGMATGHDTVVGGGADEDLNGFCNNGPGMPARYRWSVTDSRLRFRYISGHACPGFTPFLTGTAWQPVSLARQPPS